MCTRSLPGPAALLDRPAPPVLWPERRTHSDASLSLLSSLTRRSRQHHWCRWYPPLQRTSTGLHQNMLPYDSPPSLPARTMLSSEECARPGKTCHFFLCSIWRHAPTAVHLAADGRQGLPGKSCTQQSIDEEMAKYDTRPEMTVFDDDDLSPLVPPLSEALSLIAPLNRHRQTQRACLH